jgi:hypothetical protein
MVLKSVAITLPDGQLKRIKLGYPIIVKPSQVGSGSHKFNLKSLKHTMLMRRCSQGKGFKMKLDENESIEDQPHDDESDTEGGCSECTQGSGAEQHAKNIIKELIREVLKETKGGSSEILLQPGLGVTNEKVVSRQTLNSGKRKGRGKVDWGTAITRALVEPVDL